MACRHRLWAYVFNHEVDRRRCRLVLGEQALRLNRFEFLFNDRAAESQKAERSHGGRGLKEFVLKRQILQHERPGEYAQHLVLDEG